MVQRERLARQAASVLRRLAAAHEQRNDFEPAERWVRRQIKLEPWDEPAHQQLMRVLALSGRRSAALAQYETCRRLLARELVFEPSVETTRLYERIRDGQLKPPATTAASPPGLTVSLPPFLGEATPQDEPAVFVACERELERLGDFQELALAGQGRVAVVAGEAGSGKATLVKEFTRRAQEAQPDLIVASGDCNAYTAIGDPYLLDQLTLSLS